MDPKVCKSYNVTRSEKSMNKNQKVTNSYLNRQFVLVSIIVQRWSIPPKLTIWKHVISTPSVGTPSTSCPSSARDMYHTQTLTTKILFQAPKQDSKKMCEDGWFYKKWNRCSWGDIAMRLRKSQFMVVQYLFEWSRIEMNQFRSQQMQHKTRLVGFMIHHSQLRTY